MRKLLFISILFSGCFISANGTVDSLFYAPDESMNVQPVQYDTLAYNKFKRNRHYNYYEIRQEKKSLYQTVLDWINSWLYDKYHKTIASETFNKVLWALGILFIAIIGTVIYKNKAGLFYVSKKKNKNISYSIEDEDIEGQDFDRLIELAVKAGQYAEAIRRQYLKTLQTLHEKGFIAYEAFKTVNEYAYEIQDGKLRSLFRDLSKKFVYFRYGKGIAGKEIFTEFRFESEELIKSVA